MSVPARSCAQNEAAFNSLPLSSRIASARVFVRDVTVLARRSDALVVTGSSNVGRLMMLLWEAAHPREEGKRRELRSLDTRCVALLPLSLCKCS